MAQQLEAAKTKAAVKTVETIADEKMINDAPKLHVNFDVPSASHQGDLMFVRLPDNFLAEAKKAGALKERQDRQLAQGSTMGSRHVAVRGNVYDVTPKFVSDVIAKHYKDRHGKPIELGKQYVGPVYLSPKDPTENDIDHPEHGNQGFPAESVIACIYQRNLDIEEREQRARD